MLLYCIKGVRRALRTRTENYDEKEDFCTRIKGVNLGLVAGVYDLMSDFNFYLSLSDEEQESDSGKACLVFCIISTAILSLKIFWDIFVRSVSNRLRSPPACSGRRISGNKRKAPAAGVSEKRQRRHPVASLSCRLHCP